MPTKRQTNRRRPAKRTRHEATAARRRTRGHYSGRLSDLASKGMHRSFRVDPSFFGLVLDSLAEYAVLTLDRDLTISSWSAASEKVFGYTEEEIIGTPVAPLFVEEDRRDGYPEKEFDEALAKGRVSDERYHLAKGDRRFWTYGLAFPLLDEKGAVRGYVKIVRDESARKVTEDELAEKEERLRLAVAATGMATWDYLPRSDSLHLSDEGKALIGLTPDVAATFGLFISRFHAEDRENVAECILACQARESQTCEVEARLEVPGGTERWLLIKAKALNTTRLDGTAGGPRIIGLLVDSTEKKLVALQAAALTSELEQKVKERTVALMLANRELESFAYAAAHDLRGPLRKIKVYSQSIRAIKENKLDARSQAAFKRIEGSIDDMNRLIDATLNLSNATTKQMALGEVDLSALAEEIGDELRSADAGRTVRFDFAPGLRVNGDPDLLKIALRNLLENAWKFTRKRQDPLIEFGTARQAGADVYFVRDNGVGFDMMNSYKLFRPFERLHSAAEFAGTGVGLGIVERVIRRHRGRLWAESAPDHGATFYFTLFTEAL